MYIPASREAITRGPELKPFQKSLYDRLTELAESKCSIKINMDRLTLISYQEHSLVNAELDGGASKSITPEQISDMFSDGDVRVWTYLDEYSLNMFSLDHSLRQFCVDLILHSWFDRFILLSIIMNALFLAADNPLDNSHQIVCTYLINLISNFC